MRPTMLYGIEYLTAKNQHKNKMRMLCFMCGKTKYDKIRNDNIIEY